VFSSIAIFVLLIASINFINLSTARAASAQRKWACGRHLAASRYNFITQFLFESIVLCLLSVLVALVIVVVALPVFQRVY